MRNENLYDEPDSFMSPDYSQFIERFERWCSPNDLEKIKKELFTDEELDDEIGERLRNKEIAQKSDLLGKKLEEFFRQGSDEKPWLKWQPTQSQSNVFTEAYNIPTIPQHEELKRYEHKFEFESDLYFYRRDTHTYADIKKDKIYENVTEDEVDFIYGKRLVIRDSKGRFVKHIKDIKTGFWLI